MLANPAMDITRRRGRRPRRPHQDPDLRSRTSGPSRSGGSSSHADVVVSESAWADDAQAAPERTHAGPALFRRPGSGDLAELASLSGARLAAPANEHQLVSHVAPLESAGAGAITFLSDPKRLADLVGLNGAACFLRPDHAAEAPAGCALLLTSHPQASWAAAARRLHAPRRHDGAQHVHPDSELEEGVLLAPGVVIGQGPGSVVEPMWGRAS
jgi:hypothetical protein